MKVWIACYIALALCNVVSGAGVVDRGYADLTSAQWEHPVPLDGEYEFYWRKLVGPGQELEPDGYVEYPKLWNRIEGVQLENIGYASYRSQLILPKGNYTLYAEDVYSSFRIYWNGEIIAENGLVDTASHLYTPEWKPGFIPIHNLRDTNELIIQIANFDHSKGGALEGIKIGSDQVMEGLKLRIITYDLLLTGSLLMGGLFFLGLFMFGRHDYSIFYFSLFCLVYSYRFIGFGYYVLHGLIDLPWWLAIRLEYVSMFFSTFLFGRYTECLYPEESIRQAYGVLKYICLAFIAVTILAPPSVFSLLVEPFFFILGVYFLITIYVYTQAKRNGRPGAFFALASTAIILLTLSYNILVYFGLLQQVESLSFWGYTLFFFGQSLILSYRFAYDLKSARDEARMSLQVKTDFLSVMSHEIRTPLNAVVGMSHYLMRDNPRPDQLKNIQSLQHSARHLTSLVNDILDYNKIESGNIEFESIEFDLNQELRNIYQAYQPRAETKGIDFLLKPIDGLGQKVTGDRVRLGQVINNLIDNAIKFTKEGRVVLAAHNMGAVEGRVDVLIEVVDTGIGIPKDKQEAIFERFTQASSSTTREYGGTGLGLSIARLLLELQGSGLQLESEEGQGARFFFRQDFALGRRLDEASINEEGVKGLLANKRILLVEDNAMNVMVVNKFLKRWGMVVDLADNGSISLNMISNAKYDLVLMDLQMPVMDGYEAARKMRERGIKIPIIALTASALLKVQQRVLDAGMDDYITKPFDPDELKVKLIKYLSQNNVLQPE